MKAVTLIGYGGFDQLMLQDVPTPEPGPGEMLVRMHAAALNPLDNKLRSGAMHTMMPLTLPYIPGYDGAGVVERVGAGVTAFKAGDAVIGLFPSPDNGALAEYVLYQGKGLLVAKPAELSFEKAAALPEAALTAWAALEDAQVSSGSTLLLIGATGGIGLYLTQLAARQGVRVIATARPADVSYVRELGAIDTIDYTTADPIEVIKQKYPSGVDTVVDLINQMDQLYHSAEALRDGGTLVSVLFGPDPSIFPRKSVTVRYSRLGPIPERLSTLAQDAASGKLRVEIGRTFSLEQAAAALQSMEAEHILGKIVVTIP